jgi:ribosomal-protein-alanine N-acetyltransferase
MNEVKLRVLREQDQSSLVKYANNKKIADNLRDAFPHPYNEQNAIDFIRNANENNPKKLILAIDLNGELIGCIGAFQQDDIYSKNAEIGYWLAEPFWGKGYISSAIIKFIPMVFENMDIVRIYAEPFENNIGSKKALEKAGFKLEAVLKNNIFKNGELMSSCIYSILKR